MLTTCSECGKQFSDQAPACVHCGAPNAAYQKPIGGAAKFLIATVVAVVVVLGGLMIIGSDPDVQQRVRDREAYEICAELAREQLEDPAATCGPRP